jgi:hypothetical protein
MQPEMLRGADFSHFITGQSHAFSSVPAGGDGKLCSPSNQSKFPCGIIFACCFCASSPATAKSHVLMTFADAILIGDD